MTRGRWSRDSHHPFGHPPQLFVFGIEGLERRAPLVVPPFVELASHRPLKAVYFSSQSGVPSDLPPPSQPVLQAYLILNAGRYRRPWVGMQSNLGVDATRALGMAPEKFWTHMSIAISLFSSGSNVI